MGRSEAAGSLPRSPARWSATALALGLCLALPVSGARAASAAARPKSSAGASPTTASSKTAPDSPKTAAALLATFARMKGLQAQFEERKRMALLVEPLVSTGELLFAPGLGLLRAQTTPEPTSVWLTGARLRYQDASGAGEVDLRQHPALGAFARSLGLLFEGAAQELQAMYEVTYEPAATLALQPDAPVAGWRLALSPRTPQVRGLVERIVVEGQAEEVLRVIITESNGDESDVRFHSVTRAPLSKAARARLQPSGG